MKDMDTIANDSDFVFIGLPHGHAMEVGKALADTNVRIIDLGADYRFDDTISMKHGIKQLIHIKTHLARLWFS